MRVFYCNDVEGGGRPGCSSAIVVAENIEQAEDLLIKEIYKIKQDNKNINQDWIFNGKFVEIDTAFQSVLLEEGYF